MGRAPCCDKASVKKGPWSPEEDAKLKDFIEKFGTGGNWIALPQKAGLKRCGKSCRLRWLNYLRPNIRHGEFSDEEDRLICSLYATIGSRWSVIAAQLPGRTDNDIKNYWNTKLKKKLLNSLQEKQSNFFPCLQPSFQSPPPSYTDQLLQLMNTSSSSFSPTPNLLMNNNIDMSNSNPSLFVHLHDDDHSNNDNNNNIVPHQHDLSSPPPPPANSLMNDNMNCYNYLGFQDENHHHSMMMSDMSSCTSMDQEYTNYHHHTTTTTASSSSAAAAMKNQGNMIMFGTTTTDQGGSSTPHGNYNNKDHHQVLQKQNNINYQMIKQEEDVNYQIAPQLHDHHHQLQLLGDQIQNNVTTTPSLIMQNDVEEVKKQLNLMCSSYYY